ncbi:MAG: hypothetical protein KAI38_10430, partial [Candidatus Latescibacteria bacterium]|nr:hypothetical protein [Candidatus Latescibacterota bacterium]
GSSTLYFAAMTLAAIAFGGLMILFCRMYSRDIGEPEPEVDRFFALLQTPIDVEKEVGDEQQTVTAYHFVGMIVLMLAAMTLVLLLFPSGRANPVVNVILSVILAGIGFGIMRGARGCSEECNRNVLHR